VRGRGDADASSGFVVHHDDDDDGLRRSSFVSFESRSIDFARRHRLKSLATVFSQSGGFKIGHPVPVFGAAHAPLEEKVRGIKFVPTFSGSISSSSSIAT
jgi:hypothetical protein